MSLKTGEILNKRYRIDYSAEYFYPQPFQLYKAWDLQQERTCAIIENSDPEIQNDFEELSRQWMKLDHPALVKAIDFFVHDWNGQHLVISSYPSVSAEYAWQRMASDHLSQIKWLETLCDVLIYLKEKHIPLFSRALFPSSIQIAEDGSLFLNLGVLGVVNPRNRHGVDETFYIPPENQYSTGQSTNEESRTVYSLGVILFSMFVDDQGSSNREQNQEILRGENVPQAIQRIILKAIDTEPSQRYQGVAEFKDDLQKTEQKGSDVFNAPHSESLSCFPFMFIGVVLLLGIVIGGYLFEPSLPMNAALTQTAIANKTPSILNPSEQPLTPNTPTEYAPTENIPTEYAPDSVDYEITKTIRISSANVLGEINVQYPAWLRPGTGDIVEISIQVPKKLLYAEIKSGNRIDLPPTATPIIGELQNYQTTIVLDNRMRVDLASSTFHVEARTPLIQDVKIDNADNPSVWIFAITAPQAIGDHRLDISVFLDENSKQPSWFGSFQIEIVEPTLTPKATYTPTPSNWENLTTGIGAEFPKVFWPGIGVILTFLFGVWVRHLRRQSSIERLKKDNEKLQEEKKKKDLPSDIAALESRIGTLQKQIGELQEIKWWQFWYPDSEK